VLQTLDHPAPDGADTMLRSGRDRPDTWRGDRVLDSRDFDEPIDRMCRWITRQVRRFVDPVAEARGHPYHGRLKPLTELSLALFALTAPGSAPSNPRLSAWAHALAARLEGETTRLAACFAWSRCRDLAESDPSTGLAWLFLPVLAKSTGRPSPFRAALASALPPGGSALQNSADAPAYCFFLEMLELEDCSTALRREFDTVVAGLDPARAEPRCSVLYDVTHAIFFLTRFGRAPDRQPVLPGGLRDDLVRWAACRIEDGDLDLAAEILASLLYAGAALDGAMLGIARSIATALPQGGGMPTTRGRHGALGSDFLDLYHSTLVSLMALAAMQRAATGSVG
jgi:hypothetical protein